MSSNNGNAHTALDQARRALEDMQAPEREAAEQQRLKRQALAQQAARVAELTDAAREEALDQAIRTAADMAAEHVAQQASIYGLKWYLENTNNAFEPQTLETMAARANDSWNRLHQFLANAAHEYMRGWQPRAAENDYWAQQPDLEFRQAQHRTAWGTVFTRMGAFEHVQPARIIMASWLASANGDPVQYRRRQGLLYAVLGDLLDAPPNYDASAQTRQLVERFRYGR